VDRKRRAHRPDQRRSGSRSFGTLKHAYPPGFRRDGLLARHRHHRDGTDLVTAYAHVNGKRTVYIPVTKRSDASTLSVVNAVKAAIPEFQKVVPDDVDVSLEFDQSPYVTNSIRGLVIEGLLGAALTGLMVLNLPTRLA